MGDGLRGAVLELRQDVQPPVPFHPVSVALREDGWLGLEPPFLPDVLDRVFVVDEVRDVSLLDDVVIPLLGDLRSIGLHRAFGGLVDAGPLHHEVAVPELPDLLQVVWISHGAPSGYFFSPSFFWAVSICLMLFSGVGRFSGIVPPISLIIWRTFCPTTRWVRLASFFPFMPSF